MDKVINFIWNDQWNKTSTYNDYWDEGQHKALCYKKGSNWNDNKGGANNIQIQLKLVHTNA